MIPSGADWSRAVVRAEHESLGDYLRQRMTQKQRSNILFLSFNQWDFALAALADAALTVRDMGSRATCGFWAGAVPLRDAGWTTSHRLARLCGSSTVDMKVERALRAAGVPREDLVMPPLSSWKPVDDITIPGPLNRSEIRGLTYRGTPMGRAILQVHPDRETPVTDEHRWPRRWLQSAARSYAWTLDQTLALIAERAISAVAVFNGRFLHDRAVMEAARMRDLPILSYDMGGNETDFDLTLDSTHDWKALQHRMLDMYAQWPPDERDDLGSRWFMDRVAHADPQNALFVESQRSGEAIDRDGIDCLVVYFSSSGDEIAELELDWGAFFGGQGQAVRMVAEEVRKLPGHRLVVRTHPHKRFKPRQDVEEWLAHVDAARPDIHLDQFSPVDSYALMRQADIVVTYGSTTGIEAAFAGKPVIVMGPSAYDILGCVTPVSTRQELASALTRPAAGTREASLAWGLMMMRRGFNYRFVTRTPEGERSLGGVTFSDACAPARHVGHWLHMRRTRALLGD
jgi:hypothetical protein